MDGSASLDRAGGLGAARRVVVKIGSSSLTRDDGGLDLNRIDRVARAVAGWTGEGRDMIVVSSGAIAAGLDPLGLARRPRDLATAQACAATGQGLLMARWSQAFQAHRRHVAQVLLTTEEVMLREHYTNARRALDKLLGFRVVPIVNENDTVATKELRFGDNDLLAAYVSLMVGADALVLLTDVDGLYTARPGTPDAHRIDVVRSPDQLDGLDLGGPGTHLGSGGMVTKVQAASMAASSGTGVLLTHADLLTRALAGEACGTWFAPVAHRPASRTLWIAHAAPSRGELLVDAGAVRAITAGKKSLLAAGVRQAISHFEAGDVVDISGPDGLVARGIVAYDADTVARMAGHSAGELVREGWERPRPVVHRDDLAVLV